MEIIDTYQLLFNTSSKGVQKNAFETEELLDNDPIFDDPDSAYDYWVKTDIFESADKFVKEDLIKEMLEANEVQLDLQKESSNKFTSNLMKQLSIQMTFFDALVLFDVFNKNISNWKLKLISKIPENIKFLLSSQHHLYEITYSNNTLKIFENNKVIGSLDIDFEHQVIEKIYGKVNNSQFIVDPIWKYSQTTIDSVKLILGNFSTEIVHHPKHRQTLWRGKESSEIMAVTKNKTYQINNNLYFNKKQFEWPNLNIQTTTWFCPKLHFAIAGNWITY